MYFLLCSFVIKMKIFVQINIKTKTFLNIDDKDWKRQLPSPSAGKMPVSVCSQ